jgi:glycine/D-amino acid oxidase-like deaminating enzyme
MDVVSSKPFWPIRDGLPASFPRLTKNIHCNVAVIGAGITGAFVAWHLADAGIDTVVIDSGEIAHGSTAGSTSLLQYELDEPLHQLAHRFGFDFAARCYRRCRDAIDTMERLVRRLRIDCDFERKASMQLASSPAHVNRLSREFEARQAADLAVEWWPRQRLAAESTLPHSAALLSPNAAQVDAYRLAYGLLRAAHQAGARIFTRSKVTRRRYTTRGAELLIGPGLKVHARHVVIATGYDVELFVQQKLTALHSTYAIVSEPLENFEGWPAQRCLIWETARPYVYLRTTADGRAMIGGYDEPFRDPRARDRLLGAKTIALKRCFRRFFPRITLEVATAWAGTFAETEYGLPFIGRRPDIPHTTFALGYGGNGVTFSLIAAEIIRSSLLGRNDPDADLFSFDRQAGKRDAPC